MAQKTKSAAQVRAIFANASPASQKKLASEIRSGRVKVVKKKRKK